ncbi:hypothetical protein LCGC14_0515100 [marine sediment metagenome]|uniref:MotA/TolQ/ExbB proton channel domain-containing protein n=1 Tax=marine sediment metagenome TaxID=412755 RepID=A0A0F9S4Y0_9ZZZZ
MANALKDLQASGIAVVSLAAIVLTGLAVVQGFKDSGTIDNTTATKFITGLAIFGTFSTIIILAIIGKAIIGLFKRTD